MMLTVVLAKMNKKCLVKESWKEKYHWKTSSLCELRIIYNTVLKDKFM